MSIERILFFGILAFLPGTNVTNLSRQLAVRKGCFGGIGNRWGQLFPLIACGFRYAALLLFCLQSTALLPTKLKLVPFLPGTLFYFLLSYREISVVFIVLTQFFFKDIVKSVSRGPFDPGKVPAIL